MLTHRAPHSSPPCFSTLKSRRARKALEFSRSESRGSRSLAGSRHTPELLFKVSLHPPPIPHFQVFISALVHFHRACASRDLIPQHFVDRSSGLLIVIVDREGLYYWLLFFKTECTEFDTSNWIDLSGSLVNLREWISLCSRS